MGEAEQETKRAARSDWTQGLARAGLVAKGVTYAIVAALAFQVAFDAGGKLEDRPGALQTVAESTLGRFLLGALAVGLGGYALWCFAQAYLGEKLESGKDQGWLKRIGLVGRGLLYTWLFVMCLSLVLNADEPGSGRRRPEGGSSDLVRARATARSVARRPGRPRVHRRRAVQPLPRRHAAFPQGLEGGGDAARGAPLVRSNRRARPSRPRCALLLVGWFFVKAAREYDAEEAIGLDGALRKVAQAEHGDLLLGCIAAGLVAYALFCVVQARYREV